MFRFVGNNPNSRVIYSGSFDGVRSKDCRGKYAIREEVLLLTLGAQAPSPRPTGKKHNGEREFFDHCDGQRRKGQEK